MTRSKRLPCPSSRFSELIIVTQRWLSGGGFKYQKLQNSKGGTLFQIGEVGRCPKFVGMSTELNIVFH